MKINYLLPALALAFVVGLSSCGTGGAMGDAKENLEITGDLPGTGAAAQTTFEDASTSYASQTADAGPVHAGQAIEVDSTEARGNSRWSDEKAAQAGASATAPTGTRLDKTAGLRARYSLIGSNPKNRSRVGQSLSAANPEKKNEEIYIPK